MWSRQTEKLVKNQDDWTIRKGEEGLPWSIRTYDTSYLSSKTKQATRIKWSRHRALQADQQGIITEAGGGGDGGGTGGRRVEYEMHM